MHESHIRRTARAAIALLVVSMISPSQGYADATAFPAAAFGQQAAGQPIFDCTGMQATSARLKAGLPVQDEWIRRTEEQLRAAERGVTESKEALQGMAVKAALDLAQRQLGAAAELKTALENANGFSTLKRGQWLQKVDKIKQLGEAIEKASNSAAAGNRLGELMQTNRATLQDFINEISESGIADELGVKAAAFAGPVGVLVVETFMVARDTALALGSGVISASEAASARQNIAQMRAGRNDVASRAYELDTIVSSSCAPKPPAPQDRIQVQPPAEAPSTEPPPPSSGAGIGKVLGWTAVIGGGLAAGLVLSQSIAELEELSYPTTTTTTTTSQPTSQPSASANYRYGNWNCGASTQCAAVFGAATGSVGPICTPALCDDFIRVNGGNSTCTTQPLYTVRNGPAAGTACINQR